MHENCPTGPHAGLVRKASAYLCDRVRLPGRTVSTVSNDGRGKAGGEHQAEHERDTTSHCRPHYTFIVTKLGTSTKSAALVGGGVVLIIAHTADCRPHNALPGALWRFLSGAASHEGTQRATSGVWRPTGR
jgi:hypothetical protein